MQNIQKSGRGQITHVTLYIVCVCIYIHSVYHICYILQSWGGGSGKWPTFNQKCLVYASLLSFLIYSIIGLHVRVNFSPPVEG